MTHECQSRASGASQDAEKDCVNTCARVDEKNALAADLRRIHAESIRCRSLQLPSHLGEYALNVLMRSAQMLEAM